MLNGPEVKAFTISGRKSKEFSEKRAILFGTFVSIFIFFMGFGAMFFFWQHERLNYYGPKGFFFYKAATWGDGLCLSLLVGALLAYKMILGYINRKQVIVSYIIGTVLGLYGAAVQISWIMSDVSNPNWTIQKVHQFMPSGWYHAGYFVFMLFVIGTLMIQVFFARRNKKEEFTTANPLRSVLQSIIWFSGLSYLFMHNIDDFYTPENYMSITIYTFIAFWILALLYCILSAVKKDTHEIYKSTIRTDIISIIVGSFSALGFGLSVYYGSTDFLTAAVCGAFSITLVKPDIVKPSKIISKYVSVASISFFLALASLGANNLYYTIALALLMIIAPMTVSIKGIRYKIIGFILMALPLISNTILTYATKSNRIPQLASNIIAMFVTIVCVDYIPRLFNDHVIYEEVVMAYGEGANVEENKESKRVKVKNAKGKREEGKGIVIRDKGSGEVKNGMLISYVTMLPVLAASLVVFIRSFLTAFADYIAIGAKIDLSGNLTSTNFMLLGVLIVSIIGLLLIGLLKKKRSRKLNVISLIIVFISYASIIINLILIKIPQLYKSVNIVGIISIWVILWASIFVAFGFYDNTVRIRGIDWHSAKIVLAGSILIFIGCLLSCTLSVFSIDMSGLTASSIPRLFISLITIICCTLVLPPILCHIIEFPEKPSNDTTPTIDALHVGFLMMWPIALGALSALFLASFVSTNMNKSNTDMLTIICFLISCFTLISTMASIFTYCLKNNVEHLERMVAESNPERDLHAMSCHLRGENIIALIMLAPYILLPAIVKLIFLLGSADKSILKKLSKEYIPRKISKDCSSTPKEIDHISHKK